MLKAHENILGATALVALLLVLIPACSRKSTDEEMVRNAVKEAAGAAEAKDVKGFMAYISKDYHDDYGNDYDAVKGIIFYRFMRPGPISVFIRDVKVEVKGDRALVNARAVLVRGKEAEGIGSVLPENAEAYRFSLVFTREDGRWKVFNAGWEAVGAAGLL
jgi:ketosteroid isomerase-like protein